MSTKRDRYYDKARAGGYGQAKAERTLADEMNAEADERANLDALAAEMDEDIEELAAEEQERLDDEAEEEALFAEPVKHAVALDDSPERRAREARWAEEDAVRDAEFPFGCDCGEQYRTAKAAHDCRKCVRYLTDEDYAGRNVGEYLGGSWYVQGTTSWRQARKEATFSRNAALEDARVEVSS